MKEIRSFFEEPRNYFLGVVTGIGSFAGLFIWAVESSLVFYSFGPERLFLLMMLLYLGIPSILPFYNLYISGRNGPADVKFVFSALIVLGILIVCVSAWSYLLLPVWIILFVWMCRRGRSVSVSTDTVSILKENAIFEIILIVFVLLAGGALVIRENLKSHKEHPDLKAAFRSFSTGHTIGGEIESKADSIYYMKKLLPTHDAPNTNDYTSYLNTYYIYDARRDRIVEGDTLQSLPNINLTTYNKTLEDIGILSIAHSVAESTFAARFEKILQHYQTKGILIIVISALMLLFLWIILLEKEEISNRIKAHFLVTLLLVTPLMKSYNKKDITIEKPFGFKFSSEDKKDSRIKLDTLLAMQTILAGKVSILEEVTKEVPAVVENKVARMLTSKRYVNYIESIRDNQYFADSSVREEVIKKMSE